MTHIDDAELRVHVEQGRAAIRAHPTERVSLMFDVLPLLVADLDRVSLYQTEVRDLRLELTKEVATFRTLVREAMRADPEATFRNAQIHQSARAIDHLLTKITELLGP